MTPLVTPKSSINQLMSETLVRFDPRLGFCKLTAKQKTTHGSKGGVAMLPNNKFVNIKRCKQCLLYCIYAQCPYTYSKKPASDLMFGSPLPESFATTMGAMVKLVKKKR